MGCAAQSISAIPSIGDVYPGHGLAASIPDPAEWTVEVTVEADDCEWPCNRHPSIAIAPTHDAARAAWDAGAEMADDDFFFIRVPTDTLRAVLVAAVPIASRAKLDLEVVGAYVGDVAQGEDGEVVAYASIKEAAEEFEAKAKASGVEATPGEETTPGTSVAAGATATPGTKTTRPPRYFSYWAPGRGELKVYSANTPLDGILAALG